MQIQSLQPGQPIQLTTNSVFYKNIYESKIIHVGSQDLEIEIPYFKGLHVPLNIGFILNIRVFTSDGVKTFTSEVVDRNMEKRTVTIKLPSELGHAYEQAGSPHGSSKFVTISSGKGGVGKTSFCINYGIALAGFGKRVVILDADLGMANVDVLLKASTRSNIIDVIDGTKEIEGIIAKAPGGIDIIAGGSGLQRLSSLSTPEFYRITKGFTYLQNHYNYVLLDTGAGLSRNVTDFIFASDETIIVTTPEPHAITDAYSIIKVVLEQNRDVNLKLLINKCENPQEGREVLYRITNVVKNFLNYTITPMGFLVESKVVGRSIREQVPFVLSYPGSDIARDVVSLAETEVNGAPRVKEEGVLSSFVSRFKRLFGSA